MTDLSRFREAARQGRRLVGPPRAAATEPSYAPVDQDGYPLDLRGRWSGSWADDEPAASPLDDAREVPTPYGPCLVLARDYRPDERYGHWACADLSVTPDEAFEVLAGRALEGGRRERVLYVDLETTGLSGGAGTVAFLVGCAWADADGVHVRQFFLPDLSAERALLAAVAEVVGEADCLVTFNGRTFDLPVLELRGAFHRVDVPLCERPHLDLLPAARRLWRAASLAGDGSCRLVSLEPAIVGLAREGDVPGWEIPGRYFAFVRHGDRAALAPVFHHNRLDLLSLAALTSRAARLVRDGVDRATSASERYGLARLYERAGRLDDAEACYRAGAGDVAADPAMRASAWRAVALICRRARRFGEAAAAWEAVASLAVEGSPAAREAREALAIHHEHRVRRLDEARAHAEQALRLARTIAERAAIQHRLARLDRKIHRRAAAPAGRMWELSLG